MQGKAHQIGEVPACKFEVCRLEATTSSKIFGHISAFQSVHHADRRSTVRITRGMRTGLTNRYFRVQMADMFLTEVNVDLRETLGLRPTIKKVGFDMKRIRKLEKATRSTWACMLTMLQLQAATSAHAARTAPVQIGRAYRAGRAAVAILDFAKGATA